MRRRFARLGAAAAALLVIAPAFASAPGDQYDAYNRQNTTIRDAHTNLTWQRFVDPSPRAYAPALSYCAQLKLENRSWRLPTVKELLTIVDEAPHDEYQVGTGIVRLAIDGRAFPDTPSRWFWTAGVAPNVLVVDFKTGETDVVSDLSSTYPVRCVSGG